MTDLEQTLPHPLWPHQKEALKRFENKQDVFLNHDMGLGKTLTALLLLMLISKQRDTIPKTLIITTKSTLFGWLNEIKQACPPDYLKATLLLTAQGKQKQKVFDKQQEASSIIITNHDSLRSKANFDRLYAWRPEVLIVDESQKFKSRDADRTKAATKIADRATFKLLLSGTPLTNRAEDLWAQFRLFGSGKYFPENYYAFMNSYFFDENARWKNRPHYFPKWSLNPAKADAFTDAIASVMMTVKKEDALELPPIIRAPRYVKLPQTLERSYLELEAHFLTTIADSALSVDMAMTKALRLLQLCSGVAKTNDGTEHFLETEKLDALREVLDEHEGKAIIWTPWVATYVPLFNLVERMGLVPILISGDISSSKKRQELIDLFQNSPAHRVLIANPASLGVGVNLQAASLMIYYAKTYNLEHDLQSEARCHRGNSTHDKITRVDLITAGTIEETVEEALRNKKGLAAYILERREAAQRVEV